MTGGGLDETDFSHGSSQNKEYDSLADELLANEDVGRW
jgi:hypothetical protein